MSTANEPEGSEEKADPGTIEIHPVEWRSLPGTVTIIPAVVVTLYTLHVVSAYLATLKFLRAPIVLFFFVYGLLVSAKARENNGATRLPIWIPCILAAPVGVFLTETIWEVSAGNAVFTSDWRLSAYLLFGAVLMSVIPFYICVFARMVCIRLTSAPLVVSAALPPHSTNGRGAWTGSAEDRDA